MGRPGRVIETRLFLGDARVKDMPQQQSPTPKAPKTVTAERATAVVSGVLTFNLIFVVLFACSAAACGIFTFIGGGNLCNRKRNALMAGFVASIGAAITSAVSIGHIKRSRNAFQFVDQPWFVPLIVSGLAIAPAIVCGMRYLDDDDEPALPTTAAELEQLLNPVESDLLAFAGSLAIFGVAFPILGTAAMSKIPGPEHVVHFAGKS